jgi:hypothetical protein
MTQAHRERLGTAEPAAGSVVSVLLERHARVRGLFAQTSAARGEARRHALAGPFASLPDKARDASSKS